MLTISTLCAQEKGWRRTGGVVVRGDDAVGVRVVASQLAVGLGELDRAADVSRAVRGVVPLDLDAALDSCDADSEVLMRKYIG